MREREATTETTPEKKVSTNSLSSPAQRMFSGILIFAGTLVVFLTSASTNFGLSAPPENGGDSDSYERLGYNLAAGLGFGYCPSDLPILAGQEEPAVVDRCEAGCGPEQFQVTAYRPPGFPLLIAAVYRFSPLNFAAIRVLNCLACAAAVTLTGLWLARKHSITAAFLASATCCIDPRFREFAGSFLTENLATLGLCGFAVSLASFAEHKTVFQAALCGLFLSALVFVRSFYVAWYPFLWIMVASMLFFDVSKGYRSWRDATRLAMAFGVCSLLLAGPWWVRNCVALNAIMPTGTQGGIGIADGFSDSAVENFGSWTSKTADSILAELEADPHFAGVSRIEIEKEQSRRGAARASTWIKTNPQKLPLLTWWKFARLWEFGSIQHAGLFGLCAAGMWFSRATPLSRILLILFVLNSLTVMATYHTYERFLTPFRPLIHAMCAWGICAVVQTARPLRTHSAE